jgi:hypothetical protein
VTGDFKVTPALTFSGGTPHLAMWPLEFERHGGSTGQDLGVVGNDWSAQIIIRPRAEHLNGDGTVAPRTTTLKACGSTRQSQLANQFILHDGVGNGPSLKRSSPAC